MRLPLAIAAALLFFIPAFAEDAKADAPVPMKDGDVIRAICETEAHKIAGFYRRDEESFEVWRNINRVKSAAMGVASKYDITVAGRTITAKELSSAGDLEMECEEDSKELLNLEMKDLIAGKYGNIGRAKVKEIRCKMKSSSIEIAVNLASRRMIQFNTDGYLHGNAISNTIVFDDNAATHAPYSSMTLGTCTIIDGSKHLEAAEEAKTVIIRD